MDNVLEKSKVMGAFYDILGSKQYNNISKTLDNSTDRKYFEKTEPVFLEVYDSIDDAFVKSILFYERSMMGGSSSVVSIIVSQYYTPTRMSHSEAVKFYQDMANDIISEINQDKQNGV